MAYEAPKLTEIGSVRDLTLGNPWDIKFDDNSYFWGGTTPGSR